MMESEIDNEDINKYLTGTKTSKWSMIGGIMTLIMYAVIIIIGFYITGWALTYLTHKLIGSTYYTDVWTRILLGIANWLVIGSIGNNSTQAIQRANDKLNDKINK